MKTGHEPKISPELVRRISVSRYLLHLAADNGRMATVSSHACINILQDAIEMFFVASAEHLNIASTAQTRFHQYLDLIREKIGHEVP